MNSKITYERGTLELAVFLFSTAFLSISLIMILRKAVFIRFPLKTVKRLHFLCVCTTVFEFLVVSQTISVKQIYSIQLVKLCNVITNG